MQPKRSLSLRRQGIYLLPNLFTLAALFAGFYAVVQAMNNRFEHAAVAIFVAMILDGLDGRVARMTHTQSEFGAEFDSLSDMVSFGVAPSLVAYVWALKDFGKLGWIVAFIYCAGAALRLARFNTNVGTVDKRWFQGLPSPAAASLVAGLVWISIEYAEDLQFFAPALPWIAQIWVPDSFSVATSSSIGPILTPCLRAVAACAACISGTAAESNFERAASRPLLSGSSL